MQTQMARLGIDILGKVECRHGLDGLTRLEIDILGKVECRHG